MSTPKAGSPVVMWFRRDLRLVANDALAAAASKGPVLGLFVVDPAVLARAGANRATFLRRNLEALDGAMGGRLVVRVGRAAEVVPSVAAEVGASDVVCARDFSPWGRRRDAAVAAALAASGRRLRGVGSAYLHEPGSVVKPDGSGYAVFTPYWKAWRSLPAPPVRSAVDVRWMEAPGDVVAWPEPATATPPIAAGEAAAGARWESFRAVALAGYAEQRDRPAVDGTSRLSAALKWGTLHPAQLVADLDGSAPAEAFRRELCWREFYADVLFRRPETAWENLDRRFDTMEVDTDDRARERFAAWQAGRTGFPFVDAGMRQLAATGWMHNRVRMITASFLVKDLHLPWQWGARHFLDQLVDGDVASNNHGWQWVAGCGTDAAPYHRIFNPALQAERFDPDGAYVRQWVPEIDSPAYPAPIVDHAAERAEALRRRAALR